MPRTAETRVPSPYRSVVRFTHSAALAILLSLAASTSVTAQGIPRCATKLECLKRLTLPIEKVPYRLPENMEKEFVLLSLIHI